MNETLTLLIRSREGIIYHGEIKSLTSVNEQGRFDILAGHANFISLIKEILIIRETTGEAKEIKITDGILRVDKKKVEIYLGLEGKRPVNV